MYNRNKYVLYDILNLFQDSGTVISVYKFICWIPVIIDKVYTLYRICDGRLNARLVLLYSTVNWYTLHTLELSLKSYLEKRRARAKAKWNLWGFIVKSYFSLQMMADLSLLLSYSELSQFSPNRKLYEKYNKFKYFTCIHFYIFSILYTTF